MKQVSLSAVLVAVLMGASATRAQDPVKVDPKHYSVMFENDAVRVLRIHYAAGEKSVMHSHPDSVIVFLGDQKAKMTHPDGKSEEVTGKKGDAVFSPAGAHLPENIGSGPIDVILVELKPPRNNQRAASLRLINGDLLTDNSRASLVCVRTNPDCSHDPTRRRFDDFNQS
jgi:beta-alanine degradation protein BauB